MRPIISALLLVFALSCKKETETIIPVPFTYEGVYEGKNTTPSFIFGDKFKTATKFVENYTATVKEETNGDYSIYLVMSGLARMPDIDVLYGVVCKVKSQTKGNGFYASGTFKNLYPNLPEIKNDFVYGTATLSGNTLKIEFSVLYRTEHFGDFYPIASCTLKKVAN